MRETSRFMVTEKLVSMTDIDYQNAGGWTSEARGTWASVQAFRELTKMAQKSEGTYRRLWLRHYEILSGLTIASLGEHVPQDGLSLADAIQRFLLENPHSTSKETAVGVGRTPHRVNNVLRVHEGTKWESDGERPQKWTLLN